MTERIIKTSTEVTSHIDQVRALADANRSSFSFLPASAYEDAAMKGCLWTAVDQAKQDIEGYLFFGGTYPHLRVFQLYVRPEFRSRGLARTLIKELKTYGEQTNHLTVTARVATELPANRFWQRIGFRVVRQVPGGKTSGRMLNVYLLELDVPSLFRVYPDGTSSSAQDVKNITYLARPILQTPSYVMDLNVFFDVLEHRDIGESARILSSALGGEIKLSVTSEFIRELERHTRDFDNDPVLEFARKLPTLPELGSDALKSWTESLRRILFRNPKAKERQSANDASDLVHLATCIHHKAYGFVTRDATILRRAADLLEKYNLRVISPADLCEPYEDDRAPSVPISVSVGQQDIRVSDLDERDRSEVEKFLGDLGTGSNEAVSCLVPGTTQSPRVRLTVRAGKDIVGIGSWSSRRNAEDTFSYLYINEDHPDSDYAISYLLESSINCGNPGRLSRLDLKTSPRQIKTREVALSRGFRRLARQGEDTSGDLTKFSLKGVVVGSNWLSFRQEFTNAAGLKLPSKKPLHDELMNTGVFLTEVASGQKLIIPLFDFETLISPGVLICSSRPAVMIPIREEYADELFPSAVRQLSALPGKEAALRLEKAYFSGAGTHGLMSRGKIAVFYVSRRRQEAVAAARITFSGSLTKTQAVLNLGRQGVLTEREIHQKANSKGEIAVFTFDNVIVFPKSIAYRELKEMGCIGGANLVTAQELSHESLCRIVERAFGS